jgi:hypothetical protein
MTVIRGKCGGPMPPIDTPKCPLCHRTRRDDRPLCNTHLRRVGPTLLEAYFTQAKAAAKSQVATVPIHAKLAATINEMTVNAERNDDNNATGQRPIWYAGRWRDPRQRGRDILESWIRRHQFGRDPDNDHDVIGSIVTELYPTERKTR